MPSNFEPSNLPQPLPQLFSNTTNSYKFYWFLALLDQIDNRDLKIRISDMLIGMVVKVWYPINFFRLSFGTSDKLGTVVAKIKEVTELDENAKPGEIINAIKKNADNKDLIKPLWDLGRYVPTRLLRSWFANETKGILDHKITKLVNQLAFDNFHNPQKAPLYYIQDDFLFLNHRWLDYLRSHKKILQDFCYWELINFLQKKNPNVPNLAAKLFRPDIRNHQPSRRFWLEITEVEPIRCIYSDQLLTPKDFSIDHFLPWSYVSHDQRWNLTPTTRSVNSSKSNELPALEEYLFPFISLHQKVYKFCYRKGSQNKPLQDYSDFFKLTSGDIALLSREEFHRRYEDNLKPQYQIAENMGFSANWKYPK